MRVTGKVAIGTTLAVLSGLGMLLAQMRDARADELPASLVPKTASGFLLLNGTLQSVPSAIARSKTDYGFDSSLGLSAAGHPWASWDYVVFVTAAVGVDAVNGNSGSIAPEQIMVRYSPIRGLTLQAGYVRIPFSIAQSTVITNSMFPTRPEPTALFQNGADAGFLAGYESPEGHIKVKAGIFDGLSLQLTVPEHTTRGPVFSAWTELSPLGGMSPLEGDFRAGPLRVALGGGFLYRPGTAYDSTGYRGLGVDDVRFSVALRAALQGIYFQGEYLHALRTDDLSARPRLARGVYGEASYHVLVTQRIGLAPLTRVGWSVQDEGFFPLHDVSAHAGLALYPRGDLARRGSVRLVLEYQSERHIEDRETAYGGLVSVMARF